MLRRLLRWVVDALIREEPEWREGCARTAEREEKWYGTMQGRDPGRKAPDRTRALGPSTPLRELPRRVLRASARVLLALVCIIATDRGVLGTDSRREYRDR
jgi:hypothetical protein